MIVIWHKSSEEPLLAIVDEQGDTEYSVPLLLRKPIPHVHSTAPTQYVYLGKYFYHFGASMFVCDGGESYYLMESDIEWCYLESKYESEHRCLVRLQGHNV